MPKKRTKNSNASATEFLDIIYSSNLLPHIISPAQLLVRRHALIDNIIRNTNDECISSNIINTISDLLGQFLIITNCSYSYNSKKEIFQRNFKNFKEQNFLSDLKKVDWDTLFSDCKQDVGLSYSKFLDKIAKLLGIHAPVKKLSHEEKKSLSKPWLTKGILQSIKQKNALYRKFVRTKDLTKRELLLQNFKVYKNTIYKLTRIDKSDYFKRYSEENKNNSKKTWDWIGSINSFKINSHKQIKSINMNNKTESNRKVITEIFNNVFVTIASNIDSKIIHTNTNYKDYLKTPYLTHFS